jgi:hypothetical protein
VRVDAPQKQAIELDPVEVAENRVSGPPGAVLSQIWNGSGNRQTKLV